MWSIRWLQNAYLAFNNKCNYYSLTFDLGLDLPHAKVGVPYTDFKHLIGQYIFSTWQDDAVVIKLHSVKPGLGDWQEGWRCLVSCPHRSYIFDPFIYLEERSSTSVWALSVYSDSSPNFGGVQSFCSRKERYIW